MTEQNILPLAAAVISGLGTTISAWWTYRSARNRTMTEITQARRYTARQRWVKSEHPWLLSGHEPGGTVGGWAYTLKRNPELDPWAVAARFGEYHRLIDRIEM